MLLYVFVGIALALGLGIFLQSLNPRCPNCDSYWNVVPNIWREGDPEYVCMKCDVWFDRGPEE